MAGRAPNLSVGLHAQAQQQIDQALLRQCCGLNTSQARSVQEACTTDSCNGDTPPTESGKHSNAPDHLISGHTRLTQRLAGQTSVKGQEGFTRPQQLGIRGHTHPDRLCPPV